MAAFHEHLKAESAALLGRLGVTGATRWRGAGIHLLVWIAFGVLVPLRKGLDFFDPVILGAYASLGAVFAAPVAAYAQEVPSLGRAQARILACALYGELMALSMTGGGIASVYLSHRNGAFFPPELISLGEAVGFGAALALCLTTLSVWIALRFSAGAAKAALRLIFLGLLVLFLFRGRRLFDYLTWGTVVALGGAVAARLALGAALARRGDPQ